MRTSGATGVDALLVGELEGDEVALGVDGHVLLAGENEARMANGIPNRSAGPGRRATSRFTPPGACGDHETAAPSINVSEGLLPYTRLCVGRQACPGGAAPTGSSLSLITGSENARLPPYPCRW